MEGVEFMNRLEQAAMVFLFIGLCYFILHVVLWGMGLS